MMMHFLSLFLLLLQRFHNSNAFSIGSPPLSSYSSSLSSRSTTSHVPQIPLHASPPSQRIEDVPPPPTTKLQPRTGIGQTLLNLALASPLWKNVLVPQARNTMVQTAEANGIPWQSCHQWISHHPAAPWNHPSNNHENDETIYPEYYRQAFHAYEKGNLSWEAAWEQEIASCAVGARNFPKFGYQGEDVFRSSFERTLVGDCQGRIPSPKNPNDNDDKIVIVDMGCGTGTSTRRLASLFSSEDIEFVGIDLSPYFISVGTWLLETTPQSVFSKGDNDNNDNDNVDNDGGSWVNTIHSDDRITLQVGDITHLPHIPSSSVHIVNLMFVLHEMPLDQIQNTLKEAYRLLLPGGQLWISEMDFQSPAYAKQRSNPMLFSLLRATEPFLDEYADGMPEIWRCLEELFVSVRIEAATGRHYSLVATKGMQEEEEGEGGRRKCQMEDGRFQKDGSYVKDDTHLMLWESKDNDASRTSP